MRDDAGEIAGLKIPEFRRISGQAFQSGRISICLCCKQALLHSLVCLGAAEPWDLAAHTALRVHPDWARCAPAFLLHHFFSRFKCLGGTESRRSLSGREYSTDWHCLRSASLLF